MLTPRPHNQSGNQVRNDCVQADAQVNARSDNGERKKNINFKIFIPWMASERSALPVLEYQI